MRNEVTIALSVALLAGCGSSSASEGPHPTEDAGTVVTDDTATSCKDPAAAPPATFEKHVVTSEFLSEGVAVYDVDKDGHMDIVTIPYWYSGPDFTRHEVVVPGPALDPVSQYSSVYGVYPQDVDGDGCTDIIVAPREVDVQAYWYGNPRAADGRCGGDSHWTVNEIMLKGRQAGTANPIVAPLFAGSAAVLIM
ncbi:MAG: FG-GAP repeat domain-containing protein, partial [Polyangiales bacterium]